MAAALDCSAKAVTAQEARLMGLMETRVLVEQANSTAAAVVWGIFSGLAVVDVQFQALATARRDSKALCELFIPEIHVHSRLLTQETCNGTFYSNA
jgi:hypothetical protein